MTIYENNKQLLTTIGGNADNYYSTDFEVRKAILDALGGNSSMCSNIYEVDLQILKIFQEGGGAGGDITLTPITITENGVYTAGVGNGYNKVTVNVSSGGELTSKVKVNVLRVHDDSIVNGYWPAEVIDVSNVVTMKQMFWHCENLQQLDVSNWNVGNAESMREMFWYCENLQQLDVSNWDVSNVLDMWGMFRNCKNLQQLDVSNWDVSNVNEMGNMFEACNNLQKLDVSNWDVSNVADISEMFMSCYSLQSVDLSGWNAGRVLYVDSFSGASGIINYVGGRTIDEVIANNITILNGLKVGGSAITSLKADRASLRALINGLADLTGSTSQTILFSYMQFEIITTEDIAVATAKNWTIA